MHPKMAQQNYSNHIRWYPPHHFFFLPLCGMLSFGSAWCAWHYPQDRLIWLGITAAFFAITFLAIMLRQHYALGNQDRIVRLEMRLRYYQLTGERLEQYEHKLSQGQMGALRFASDAELPALLQRALAENLSADAIKRAVQDWLPDEMRR